MVRSAAPELLLSTGKGSAEAQEHLAEPVKQMIEESPSFGYRISRDQSEVRRKALRANAIDRRPKVMHKNSSVTRWAN